MEDVLGKTNTVMVDVKGNNMMVLPFDKMLPQPLADTTVEPTAAASGGGRPKAAPIEHTDDERSTARGRDAGDDNHESK